jgi:hypothetical protein
MATPDEITAFRLIIDERDPTHYTDQTLSDRMDASTDHNLLASGIWLEKAARYSALVDMQEGTSRRSLSQMVTHALLMARTYSGLSEDADTTGPGKRTTTRAIERI